MKTQEELKRLKAEYEALNNKLKELAKDELVFVTGGTNYPFVIDDNDSIYDPHFYPDRGPDFEPNFSTFPYEEN